MITLFVRYKLLGVTIFRILVSFNYIVVSPFCYSFIANGSYFSSYFISLYFVYLLLNMDCHLGQRHQPFIELPQSQVDYSIQNS